MEKTLVSSFIRFCLSLVAGNTEFVETLTHTFDQYLFNYFYSLVYKFVDHGKSLEGLIVSDHAKQKLKGTGFNNLLLFSSQSDNPTNFLTAVVDI